MENLITEETHSTWKTKLKAMGPGILMASAAVGGSHIVSSAQAGAIYGWQLLLVVILVNLFKYPFFRFGVQYTLNTEKSLVEGYSYRGKAYLWVFFILNVFDKYSSCRYSYRGNYDEHYSKKLGTFSWANNNNINNFNLGNDNSWRI